jgi:diguanylate cyclase (GGDEF)-like protein/PAS domain S-box-containing protein
MQKGVPAGAGPRDEPAATPQTTAGAAGAPYPWPKSLRLLVRSLRRLGLLKNPPPSRDALIERGLREMDSDRASLYQQIFESSPAAMALTNPEFEIVVANPALAQLLERSGPDICGRPLTSLCAPPYPPRLQLMAEKAAQQDATVVVEHRLGRETAEGWARTSMRRLATNDANFALVVVVEDMTSAQEALEQQRREAELDPLTGLLNRRGGDRRLRGALDRMAQNGAVAVILFDTDGFKEINDRYGHTAGDEILAGIAGRLRSAIRYGDDVARLGGDEFIVVASVAGEEEAGRIAERCVAAVAEPFRGSKGDHPLHVTLSAGVAVARPGDGGSAPVDVEALIDGADRALYRAKNAGGNRWVLAEGR